MKGLRLEVDFSTGRRAGGLDPKDRRTACNTMWQDVEGGVEIRVIADESVLRDIDLDDPGVTVLETDADLDAAIDALDAEEPATIRDSTLVVEHLRQKGLSLDDLTDGDGKPLPMKDVANRLHDMGIVGTERRTRVKPKGAEAYAAAAEQATRAKANRGRGRG